jgi:hypothetical protein
MKVKSGLVLLILVLTLAVVGNAQEPASAAENAEKLRAQLLEVQGKEEALRARAQQLEESLKPENIERSSRALVRPGLRTCANHAAAS